MTDTEGEEPEYERLLPEEPKKTRIPTPPPTLPVLLTELFTSSIGCFAFVIFLLTCMSYLILQYKCVIPYRPYGAYVIVEMVYLMLALLFSYFLLFHLDSFTTKLRSSGTIAMFVVIYLLSFMMLPIMGWMLFAGAFTPLNQMRVTAGINNTPIITPRCPNLDSSVHEKIALLLNITHSSLVILFCFGCCHVHKPKEYTPALIEPQHQESSDDEGEIQRHVRIRTSSHVVPIEESISRQASIAAANKGRSASVVNLMAPVFGTATDLSTTTASSISIHPEPLPHIHSRHQSLTTASPITHQRSSIGSKSAPISRQSSIGTTSAPISRLSSISVILQQHQQSQSQAMPLPHPSTLHTEDESPPDSPPRRQQSIVRASSAYDFTPTIKGETAEPVL